MKDKYKIFTVSLQESILDALKKIDANTFGFLIVVSGLDKFLGVLTDGDIRRVRLMRRFLQFIIKKRKRFRLLMDLNLL